MNIRTKAISLIITAAAIVTGCKQGDDEHRLVGEFLDKHLTNNSISDLKVSDADSTFLINDSLINVMRTAQAKTSIFKKDVVYGERCTKAPLYYVVARYTTHDGRKVRQTFYLNKKNNSVVCIKNDPYDEGF